uniref:Putative secreted protein n=1 Tax=Ixodes ricinus TaxID=34613 RepID=A0A6B0TQY7_IXORI
MPLLWNALVAFRHASTSRACSRCMRRGSITQVGKLAREVRQLNGFPRRSNPVGAYCAHVGAYGAQPR